jgi:hypothetical protein
MIFSPSSGATSLIVNNKPLGTYSYFLKATGEGGSEQSVIRSVTVSDLPDQFAFLVIGIGDYQNMPSSYTLYAQMGNDLKYPIYDATDIQDMLKVYGATSGEPFGQVLTLLNSRATKTGIQNAITGGLDSHEAANTTVFIYFSGHTLVSDQKPYLAPFDLTCSPCADLSTNSTWLPSSGISAEEINSWLGELASTHFIFIIDSQGSERWISELRENDRTILAGSRTTEDRWEFNEIRNGAFSYYLNQAYLNNADLDLDGKVSIQEIYSYTYSPPTLSSFVYNHSILIKDGQNQQHAVLNSGANSTLGFLSTNSVQACHQMP